MENYIVNYHTGAGNTGHADINSAMGAADHGASYTQQDITIEQDDIPIAVRRWVGCLDGLNEQEYAIRFGDYGYYTDWEEV